MNDSQVLLVAPVALVMMADLEVLVEMVAQAVRVLLDLQAVMGPMALLVIKVIYL